MKKYLIILFLSFSILSSNSIKNRIDTAYQMKNLDRTIIEATFIYIDVPTKVINDIKSKLIGYVQDNIYAFHGRNILIPKGSSAECIKTISSLPTKCTTRIITPQGKYITFTAYWKQINTSFYISPDEDVVVNIN